VAASLHFVLAGGDPAVLETLADSPDDAGHPPPSSSLPADNNPTCPPAVIGVFFVHGIVQGMGWKPDQNVEFVQTVQSRNRLELQ
jgi:hypothetical protein